MTGLRQNEPPPEVEDANTPTDSKNERCKYRAKIIIPLLLLYTLSFLSLVGCSIYLLVQATTGLAPVSNQIPNSLRSVIFDGRTKAINSYKGPPRNELDSTWRGLYDVNPFGATRKDLKKLDKTSVEIPTRQGHYFVSLAVFHQLHCLDIIRRYVHSEYYRMDGLDSVISVTDHVDHCIDMVRQALMCHADTTLITWNGTFVDAEPDFYAKHQCRNFDLIHKWSKKHEVNMEEEFVRDPEALKRIKFG